MAFVQSQSRLFGLDLKPLWNDLLEAWRGMLDWPVLAWLRPRLTVRLVLPSGVQAICADPCVAAKASPSPQALAQARFEAVVLPEHLLLRRDVVLPALSLADQVNALALEVQSLSPFMPEDLVWAYRPAGASEQGLLAHVVLSSRKRIAEFQADQATVLKSSNPEVWAEAGESTGFVVLGGFGERQRQRASRFEFGLGVAGLSLVLVLLGALAVTPSVQMFMRFLQAEKAMADLQSKAKPALQQREAMVRANDQLAALHKLVGDPLPPLQTLQRVTAALPDDTALRGLQITANKVNINGQTANAAALMKQLEATAGLHDVVAPVAATKPLGATRETFTIEFQLDKLASPAKP